MTSLRELQRAFAAAIAAGDSEGAPGLAVRPAANLAVYRNNADWQFRNALGLSFPVLRRRVGDDYFRQLAFHYRRQFPSRSGDLHWVGRDFPAFLDGYLAGSDYAWLADLARLEWSREMASIAAVLPGLEVAALAGIAAEDLETTIFGLQPSLTLGASDYPVFSVWMANRNENAPPVDPTSGGEWYLVQAGREQVTVAQLTAPVFAFLSAIAAGAPLGDAVSHAGLDERGLLGALQFAFANELVVSMGSSPHHVPGTVDHSANR
jgi:hypothetical protein